MSIARDPGGKWYYCNNKKSKRDSSNLLKLDKVERISKERLKMFDVGKLCTDYQLSEKFMNENWDRLDHDLIATYQKLSLEFISSHLDDFDYLTLLSYQESLSPVRGGEYANSDLVTAVKEFLVSELAKKTESEPAEKVLSSKDEMERVREKTMGKYFEYFDLPNRMMVAKEWKLSEEFIEEHWGKLPHETITRYQKLSHAFILRHLDELIPSLIIMHQNIGLSMDDFISHGGQPGDHGRAIIKNYIELGWLR